MPTHTITIDGFGPFEAQEGQKLVLAIEGVSILRTLTGEMLVSVDLPVALTQSVIPIGAALFIVAELLNLPDRIAWASGRQVVTVDQTSKEVSH